MIPNHKRDSFHSSSLLSFHAGTPVCFSNLGGCQLLSTVGKVPNTTPHQIILTIPLMLKLILFIPSSPYILSWSMSILNIINPLCRARFYFLLLLAYCTDHTTRGAMFYELECQLSTFLMTILDTMEMIN